MTEHHHSSSQHRAKSKWLIMLRNYRVEFAWLLLVLVGLFLLFERLSIRSSVIRWLHTLLLASLGAVGRVDDLVGAFLSRVTLSDAIGMLLVGGAAVGIILRVRWRLLRTPALTRIQCPSCGGELHRVHRRRLDRLASWFVPLRRYRCANRTCSWSGLRVHVSSHQHSRRHTQS